MSPHKTTPKRIIIKVTQKAIIQFKFTSLTTRFQLKNIQVKLKI